MSVVFQDSLLDLLSSKLLTEQLPVETELETIVTLLDMTSEWLEVSVTTPQIG